LGAQFSFNLLIKQLVVSYEGCRDIQTGWWRPLISLIPKRIEAQARGRDVRFDYFGGFALSPLSREFGSQQAPELASLPDRAGPMRSLLLAFASWGWSAPALEKIFFLFTYT
jgi:hypothetical protein